MSAAQTVGDSARHLFEAIKTGNASRVEELLDQSPGLVSAGFHGASPVLTAVYCGHPELVALFEQRGIALDLFEACAAGRTERVTALLDSSPLVIHEFSPDGFPALGLAVYFGHDEIAGMLIASGAEVNAASRNSQRVTALHAAATRSNRRMVAALLAAGADPNAEQDAGFAPLDSAAFRGDREIVELLLGYGADPRHKTAAGKTAADIALESGHADLAAQLAQLAA